MVGRIQGGVRWFEGACRRAEGIGMIGVHGLGGVEAQAQVGIPWGIGIMVGCCALAPCCDVKCDGQRNAGKLAGKRAGQ